MKKIIEFFKKLLGIKKKEVKPVVKPTPKRKPRKKTSGGGGSSTAPKKPSLKAIK